MSGNTQAFERNSKISGNNPSIETALKVDIDMMSNQQAPNEISGGMTSPITEAVQERCIHRTIVHEGPQEW